MFEKLIKNRSAGNRVVWGLLGGFSLIMILSWIIPSEAPESEKVVKPKTIKVQKVVPQKAIKPKAVRVPVNPPKKLYVIPKKLNVREGPGLNYKVTDYLPGGSEVKVITICGDWAEVKGWWVLPDGWVYRKYLGSKSAATLAEQKREVKRRQYRDEWVSAGMRIYPGVKIYYGDGPQKRYVGTVIETGKIDGKRAVLLEPGGWKYRNSLIQWGWVLRSQYEEARDRYLGE